MEVASREFYWAAPLKGTVLVLEVTAETPGVMIRKGTLAAGSDSVTVNWGDGKRETLTASFNYLRHTYSRPGRYKVAISDDLREFAFTDSSQTAGQRNALVGVPSFGLKVTTIPGYGFNNCQKLEGVLELPSVTSIGSYTFGSTYKLSEFRLPSMTRLEETVFYWGPGASKLYADNVRSIGSQFWNYYGRRLTDVYLRGMTREEIKAMPGFPFVAPAGVRFYGSNGIVLSDGSFA